MKIDHQIRAKQLDASNPNYSVWVSASAGTGKTTVLTKRILRLLLNNISISKILCITYTKKAATEMLERLMDTLAKWAVMEQEDLRAELEELCGTPPSANQIDLAYSLFYSVLNTPYEIRIQTIHSFCQSILAKFPKEAGLTPNFITLEDNNIIKKQLMNQAITLILKRYKKEAPKIINEITKPDGISLSSFEKIVNYYISSAEIETIYTDSDNFIQYNNNYDVYKKNIYEFFKISPLATSEILENFYKSELDINKFANLQNIFNSIDSEKILQRIKNHNNFYLYCNDLLSNKISLNKWLELFLTVDKGNLKLRSFDLLVGIKKTLSEDIQTTIISTLQEEGEKILQLHNNLNALRNAEISYSLSCIIFDIYKEYSNLKNQGNFLDYADQILKTVNLLKTDNMPWILYKMDQTIEHILVDEAQDTSPLMWDIILAFIQEFFSGKSLYEEHHDNPRTIFIVGDIKQSIYRFQGANPYEFEKVKNTIQNLVVSSNNIWKEIPLDTSFRSSSGIIEFVNSITHKLFDTTKSPYTGENLDHRVSLLKQSSPFHIEIWPHITYNEEIHNHKDQPFINLATEIAEKIKDLHKTGISFKDIAILYEKRNNNKALNYLIKILKQNNIPVLGLDKIYLTNNIAVQDLISLAKFISYTGDNLSLACVLKSPLFELNDIDLINIHNSNKQSDDLFTCLEQSNNNSYQKIYNILNSWITLAHTEGVISLYYDVVYRYQGLNKFSGRLGEECKDIIHQFIDNIISFVDMYNSSSIFNYVEYINMQQNIVVSKEQSSEHDYIKLFTIHGAKGLQAKVIFLLHNITSNTIQDNLIFSHKISNFKDHIKNAPKLALYKMEQKALSNPFKKLIAAKNLDDNEEKNRLLYVAITRPEEQLYICTISNNKKSYENNSWYKYFQEVIQDDVLKDKFLCIKNDRFDIQKGFIHNKSFIFSNGALSSQLDNNPINTNTTIPTWVNTSLSFENPLETLTPSNISFVNNIEISPLKKIVINNEKNNSRKNINKGLIIHKILEQINYTNFQDASFIVSKFLDNLNLTTKDKEEIQKNINNVIKNPNLEFIFTNYNFNEVSISGMLEYNNNDILLLARIDKIVKMPDKIIIVDYKFSHKSKNITKAYINQLTLYKNLIRHIYPNFIIKAYIIFTPTAEIIEI